MNSQKKQCILSAECFLVIIMVGLPLSFSLSLCLSLRKPNYRIVHILKDAYLKYWDAQIQKGTR